MKNSIIYYFLLIVLIAVSCKDESEIRIPEFKAGPNVRIQIDPNKSFFDFQDKENTYLGYGFYSQNKDLDKVDILVTYLPVGGTASAQLVVKTYTQEDINAAGGSLPDERITLASLATLFGVDLSTFKGGDQFNFNNRTTMADGTVYPSATVGGNSNVPSDLVASAGTTSYTDNFSAVIGCQVTAAFTGDYQLAELVGPGDPFNGDAFVWTPGKVTISSINPVARSFTGLFYDGGSFSFPITFTFILLCGEVSVPKFSTGINCGGPSFSYQSVGSNPYNDTDDDVILINLTHNIDGACGQPVAVPITLRLTKL
jgi:hypothetical protein